MPGTGEQPTSTKPPDGSRRVYVWWGVGMGLLTGLALFCWLVASPVLEVRREVGTLYVPIIATSYPADDEEYLPELLRYPVERIGGPTKARSKIWLYLHTPERVAPCKRITLLMLSECGEPAVDMLIKGLYQEYERTPMASDCAAWALGRIGPSARKAILPLVDHVVSCSGSETYYIEALLKIDPQGTETVPLLTGLLSHKEAKLRSGAAHVLGFYGPAAKPAVPLLIKALDDPATARAAVRALVCLGPEAREAVPALIKALGSEDASVRRDAIWALGRIGPEAGAAAPALLAIVLKEGEKGDQEARCRAAAALGRLGRSVVPGMVAALEGCLDDRDPLGGALVMIGPEAVPETLKIKDDYCGLNNVLGVLGEIGRPAASAMPWLIEKLQRAEAPWARPDIASTLGRSDDRHGGTLAMSVRLPREGSSMGLVVWCLGSCPPIPPWSPRFRPWHL